MSIEKLDIFTKEQPRSLAHVEVIDALDDLPGYDRVVSAHVLGWRTIVGKEDTHVGDKVVYFEIDSLVPSNDERFAFMTKRHYRVKTQKMCKSISQGLAMPLSLFPELGDLEVGTDVTEQLGVTYYLPQDRTRKSTQHKSNPFEKYERMLRRLKATHPKLFDSWVVKKLRKPLWGKAILYFFFGKDNKDLPKLFPYYVKKSDQIRIENIPWILENTLARYEVTEKLDGTSCTYAVKRLGNIFKDEYDYAVCSRNLRQIDADVIPYQDFDTNVYHEMSQKYDIRNVLEAYAKENNYDCVYIQGECIGDKIQKNPYHFKPGVRDLYVFELVIEGQKQSYKAVQEWCEAHNMKSVPLLDECSQVPTEMEKMKELAEDKSKINSSVFREGLVFRKVNKPEISFKNVANSYLLKHESNS